MLKELFLDFLLGLACHFVNLRLHARQGKMEALMCERTILFT